MTAPASHTAPVGAQIRHWRARRRLSQLELALEADVSTRHLSCLETGRAAPSREMILRLANRLDVPLRERNRLLTAAGFAPMYPARPLADPALAAAREVVELVLRGHEPCPALAVDRHWNVVMQNRAVPLLLDGVAPDLLEARSTRCASACTRAAWRRASSTSRPGARTCSPACASRSKRATTTRCARSRTSSRRTRRRATRRMRRRRRAEPALVVPLVVDSALGRLSFISTTTVFGTPVDVTLAELALESFFPADAATTAALRAAFATLPDADAG